MPVVYLIIDMIMNTDNNSYLEKSLIHLFTSKTLNKINISYNFNKKNMLSCFKIYDNKLYFIYNDEVYLDTEVHQYINLIQNYIKNIYPEYGNNWYISYKKCDTDIIYTVNNLCNIV
jgi:hypothetical protein